MVFNESTKKVDTTFLFFGEIKSDNTPFEPAQLAQRATDSTRES
jgi:hypothetical protein